MLVSACSVNITLVFIMSGGCVTKVHLDTWDLMCLLLSLSPQGSLYLKLWAELYSQHFTISAFQTVPGQQATLHCPILLQSTVSRHNTAFILRCRVAAGQPATDLCTVCAGAWPHHHSAAPHFNLTWRAWVLGSARYHRLSYFCYCMEWVL